MHLADNKCHTKSFNISTLLILTYTLSGTYSYFLHVMHEAKGHLVTCSASHIRIRVTELDSRATLILFIKHQNL